MTDAATHVRHVFTLLQDVLQGDAPAERKVEQCRVLAIMGAKFLELWREEAK